MVYIFVEGCSTDYCTKSYTTKNKSRRLTENKSKSLSLSVILKSKNSTLADKLKLFLLKISTASQLCCDEKI